MWEGVIITWCKVYGLLTQLSVIALFDRNSLALQNWIANAITDQFTQFRLNLEKLLGHGCDDSSTMAEKEDGVQYNKKNKYPNATFVHYASLKLNFVAKMTLVQFLK